MRRDCRRPAQRAGALLATTLATAATAANEADSPAPGIALDIAYVGDVFSNTRGGLQRGTAYLDNLDVMLSADAAALGGPDGLTFYVHGLYNNASTFSERYVGDAFVASNIDTGRAVRLYEAWADWAFGGGGSSTSSLRVGLYDLNSEFDALDSRGLFINSTYGIGQDFAQTGENGPSIFPATALGARLAWTPVDRWLLEVAVVDGVPGDPDDPRRTSIDLSSDDGALIATEVTTSLGAMTQLSLGYWRYTADFEELAPAIDGAEPQLRDDNDGFYVTGEIALNSRSTAFVRAGAANGDLNPFDRYYAAGIVFDSLLPGGRGDQLGIAAAAGRTSSRYRDLQSSAGAPADDH